MSMVDIYLTHNGTLKVFGGRDQYNDPLPITNVAVKYNPTGKRNIRVEIDGEIVVIQEIMLVALRETITTEDRFVLEDGEERKIKWVKHNRDWTGRSTEIGLG